MSKTKTSIINADILNSKINTENYNNVYDMSTPIFNKLGSIPSTYGKMASYQFFTDNTIKWRKYVKDSYYIDLLSNDSNLRDSNGKYKGLTDTVQIDDVELSNSFLDITKSYILREGGLYSSTGLLLAINSDFKLSYKAALFELQNGTAWITYYKSGITYAVFYSNGSTTALTAAKGYHAQFAYDINNDWLLFATGTTVYRLTNTGALKSATISNDAYFCYGQTTVKAIPGISMTVENKQPVMTFKPATVSVVSVAENSASQKVADSMSLKWDGDTVTVVYKLSDSYTVDLVSTASEPNTAYYAEDDSTFRVTCSLSSGKHYFWGHFPKTKKTNDYFRRFTINTNGLIAYVGFQNNSTSMISWREYSDWLIFSFDGQDIVTYKKNLVIPLGFADKILEISTDSLIYISSVDQKVHYLKMSAPSADYMFRNTKSIDLLSYSSQLDFLSIFNSTWANTYFLTISSSNSQTYISDWINNSSLKTLVFKSPVVLGQNINYIKSKSNLTLATSSEYYFAYSTSVDIGYYFRSAYQNVGELYFFTGGTPSQEYAVIPLVLQNETAVELDLEVERDIPNRMPAPVGVSIACLTPTDYIFRYNDVTIKYATVGGSVINAFDIVTDSFVSSDDYIDNLISLRGNLYTIKNSSIYSVSSDFKDLAYLSSLGRCRYLCHNDSLILFYDNVLKCLVSYDASNSWSVFLNVPLLTIIDAAISNQNEIVLLTQQGIFFSRNNTMTLLLPDDWTNYSLFSSNGIEVACGNIVYGPGTKHTLSFETSWLGLPDCRRLFQLDTIYLEFEIEDNATLDFQADIEMLIDDEVSAGDFSYTVETVGKLKYIRLQPSVQRCNAFKWSLTANASLKRLSYSITTDEELLTVTAPALQEIRL